MPTAPHHTAPSSTPMPNATRTRRATYVRLALIVVGALALNVLVLFIPPQWIEGLARWGIWAYVAVFGVTALANASVIVPVPYPGIVARFASVLGDVWGVALAGAAGSTVGEGTAFLVGRAGKGIVEDTRFYRWLKGQLRTPLRAFIVLFLLSAPPNPFFDIAGLTAGTLGVPFPLFFGATFLGRIIKMLFFAGLGQQLLR